MAMISMATRSSIGVMPHFGRTPYGRDRAAGASTIRHAKSQRNTRP
jgi:hypothetical protein